MNSFRICEETLTGGMHKVNSILCDYAIGLVRHMFDRKNSQLNNFLCKKKAFLIMHAIRVKYLF